MTTLNVNQAEVDIAIIGAGPAGISAAIAAVKLANKKQKKLKISIFESKDKIGQSILKTGNGRCNFSNFLINEEGAKSYYNKDFCEKVFSSCQEHLKNAQIFDYDDSLFTNPALQMFEDLGMACYVEDDGKMFPYTNKASTVVDVLRYAVEELGINCCLNYTLTNYKYNSDNKKFVLQFDNNKRVFTDRLIITTGSLKKNNFITKDEVTSTNKILGPIKTETKFTKGLDGVRVHAGVSLCCADKIITTEIGELLFRKYGLSGICIFNLSRYLRDAKEFYVNIDFAPEDSLEDLTVLIKSRFARLQKKNKEISIERLLTGLILPSVAKAICSFAKLDNRRIKETDLDKLSKAIKTFCLKARGIGDDKQCQVTRGGIKVSALNSNSLSLKRLSKLFFAGEIIDVDGPCGGYNLHWAWVSGILAGLSASKNI